MYVVVEFDPERGQYHVLFPRYSMSQVHQTLQAALNHRDWYVEAVYGDDLEMGYEHVQVYRLDPI